tara:strand:- start:2286 stop:2489 length:204 start_codon:yes stop_codon:yes gene_type:complete
MIDFSAFTAGIAIYTLWVAIRLHKKVDMLGHVGALILTQLSKDYTSNEYPEEEIDEAIKTWDNWDSA